MSVFSTVKKGSIGERYVVKHLKRRKFRIIDMNMRNKISEIDIIAENKEYIIFVEVKSRSCEGEMRPVYAVDKRKQRKIMTAAQQYILYNKITKQPRFDIAEVFLSPESSKPYKINYIENAYVQGGDYAVL